MAVTPRQPPRLRPAAVAIHDDGSVSGRFNESSLLHKVWLRTAALLRVRARSALAHPPDQRFHVVEVVVERGAPGVGESVLRTRCPRDEGFLAGDKPRFLEASRVHAEVAVGDV